MAGLWVIVASAMIGAPTIPARAQQYFNGAQTTPNGAINGGGGVWDNSTANWTNATGTASNSYDADSGTITVFGSSGASTPATAGTVSAGGGSISLTGTVQFRATGDSSIYTLADGYLALSPGGTTFDVGSVAPGAAPSAEISATIVGNALTKTGAGTLNLSGANAYSGSTTVSQGILIAGHQSGGFIDALGNGDVLLNGGTLQADVSGSLSSNITFNDSTTSTLSPGAQILTVNGAVTLNANSTAQFGKSGDTGTLVLAGGGTADATAAVVIASGTVQDGGNASITSLTYSAGSTTVNAGATLDFNDAFNQGIHNLTGAGSVVTGTVGGTTLDLYVDGNTSSTFSGAISGPGRVLIATSNFDPVPSTTIFTGTNTYSGGTEVCQCTTLQLGDGGMTGSIAGDVALGGTLIFNRSNTYSFDGTISDDGPDSGKVVQNGTGKLILTGNNDYSGGTTINAGTLSITNGNAIGSGDLALGQGTAFQLDGSFTLANNITIAGDPIFDVTPGNTSVVAGTISDATAPAPLGVVEKTGAGTLVLAGANTYSGGTVISAGILQVTNNSSVGAGMVTLDGGTFQTDGSSNLAFANGFKVNTTGGAIDNNGVMLALTGTISNGNGGAGVLQLTDSSGGHGITVLSGVNTYSGGTNVLGATVEVTNNSSVGSGTVALENALFHADGLSDLTFSNNFRINDTASGSAIDANGVTLTIAGNIADGTGGPGKLTVLDYSFSNLGVVVLTGTNTYSGGTTICYCATLQLGDLTHTASIVGAVSNEGTFNIVNANTARIISITNDGHFGGFAKTTFFGANTAGTATIVNTFGGSTSFVDASSAGSANVTNHTGTTVFGTFFGSDTSTAAHATIDNNNGGTTFLAQTNAGFANIINHNGGGTIFEYQSSAASATLTNSNMGFTSFGQPGGTDAPTAGSAMIINNAGGETHFNAFSTAGNATVTTNGGGFIYFYDNSTGGNAQFITSGSGFVDFSGSLGPNGDGRISAGSIAGSGSYYIGGGNTLVVGGNNLYTTVSGVIADNNPCGCTTGPGSLEKVGNGTLTLTGVNTYTGTTAVNGGILEVDGSIASSSQTTVNANAALIGVGTVGDTLIASGGLFAPGNTAPGTFMTVAGNLAFQSGALYLVQLDPSTSTLAKVTGTATLTGAAGAAFLTGNYLAKRYTILTAAGGVAGTFSSFDTLNKPNSVKASLSYDANDVYLDLAIAFGVPGGLNQNQQNVGNALTNFFNGNGGIPLVFAQLTPGQLAQASGELATGSQQATFDAMNLFLSLLTDPFIDGRGGFGSAGTTAFADEGASAYAANRQEALRDAFARFPTKAVAARNDLLDPRWSVWGAAYGGGSSTDGNAALGSNATTARAFGLVAGADYRMSPSTIAGFALAGGGTGFSVNGSGSGRSDLFQAGAFVRHDVGAAYVTGALAYGFQNVTTNRTVTIAGFDQLRAQFDANAWSGRVEGGYRYVTPWMGVTPYAAGQFTAYSLPAYAEQVLAGTGTFALNYAARDVTASRSELGARTDRSFAMQEAILTLRGRLAWAHDFNTDRAISAVFQTLPGASFVVNGAAQAHDSALTTASAEMKWRNGFSLAATFEGQFSGITTSYAGKGVARYNW